MKDYHCPNEVRIGTEIRCAAADDLCGHVKYCRYDGRWKLTEQSLDCPLRKKEEENA